jgi:hypothetical protein
MRHIGRHGANVGGVGWLLLAATDTEMKIADVQKKKCRDCGQLLKVHAIVGSEVVCPPVVMAGQRGGKTAALEASRMTEEVILDAIER